MRGHRGLAVGRDPRRTEAAILLRPETQRALSGLLEDKAVLDDMALAPTPCRAVLVVDARAERVDRCQIVAMRRFDAEQYLTAVRVKSVPDIAETLSRLGG